MASQAFTGASRGRCGTPTPPTTPTLSASADRRSPALSTCPRSSPL